MVADKTSILKTGELDQLHCDERCDSDILHALNRDEHNAEHVQVLPVGRQELPGTGHEH